LSRTAHHVPQKHWNQREILTWGPGSTYDSPIGHVIYDLRFPAGCRRRPRRIRATVYGGGYIHGHGGAQEVKVMAAEYEASLRNGWRMFAAAVAKAHRAAEDVEDFVEPDGRTLHSALWDLT
jgi:hypothetical protein